MRLFTRRRWLTHVALPAAVWCVLPDRIAHAQTKWIDQRAAGPFVCSAMFRLDPYGGLFQELAELQVELTRVLGIQATREPVELYLFADKSSYRKYLKEVLPQAPYRRALFVKAGGPGTVYAHLNDEFEIDLRHESTHGLLHGTLPMVPLWLDEGLAEYFEVPADRRAFHNPHLAVLRWNVRLGMVPKLKSLEMKHDLSQMGRSEYRYSWAWVHFMLHGPREAHDELVRYLGDIQARTPPGQLSDRLERRLPNVEAQLIQHFKNWKR